MQKLSIVILNWNGAEMLRKFLPSVIAHSEGEGIEVCVADNASTDNSLEVMRTEFPDVRLILLDRNYGFAEGYNRALAEVDAEYSLLLNSDVEVAEGWLSPMLTYMDTHPEDQEGLQLLKEMLKRRKTLLKEFALQYYPLTVDCMYDVYEENTESTCYCWPEGKIPWERSV